MKKYFITGLVTLLPLAVTIWFVSFLVNFLTKPFVGITGELVKSFGIISSTHLIRTLSQILILIAIFLFLFFLGFVARRFFFHTMLRLGDRLIIKIPLVNKVYKTSKELVQSLFVTNKGSFHQVVLLSFPYRGCYCIGLVASLAPRTCSKVRQEDMISVFIPTTPNPATGFLVMAAKHELVYLDMKPDEAIKYVVSCAVIQPERGKK